jgi:DNA-binding MarR family transcriptional regulator
MNMKEIEVLSELVNYDSYSDAAFSLSYSPSVISKYVSSIERELGIRIIVRGNKSNELSLTPEGRVLIQNIHKLNTDYQRMMELSRQLKGSFENVLRVGSQARFGNQIEQEILASFLLNNFNTDLEQVKMNSKDLLKLLQVGKLDAMFMSVHESVKIEHFFRDMEEYQDIEVIFLTCEREIYLGISTQYLPGITKEARFADFKDFSFAFAFPLSGDENDSKAIESFMKLARQNGFKLNRAFFGAHDATVLKLATKMPIAVTTTNIPAQFDGIKFIRVSDWNAYTNIYFLCLKSNRKKTLLNLKNSVRQYLEQSETAV